VSEDPLVCPSCARPGDSRERFCAACGMPLVYADREAARQGPGGKRREMARKIKPQYSEGKLVKIASASNQPEAELLQGLLLEQGIPSMVRRSRGFDVAESLAAGPRDVLVPESGAQAAREALAWES
jgi:predicted amidophosphoribosyltransferase